MNKFGFSFKLALSNIRKNGKFYIPFLLIGILSVTMFFNMHALMKNNTLPNSSEFATIIAFGVPVIGFFCMVFMLYTNSFLIKRRKKELGIYNILGMEKRHIARVITWETLISAFICIGGGITIGSLLNRLMFMALEKALSMTITVKFQVGTATFVSTIVFYAVVFGLILIKNLIEITKAKPVELLSGGNVGEKEPKTKWPITVLGLISLILGYTMAVTTKNASDAITFFFVAVILVMIGTYCLFVSGSIAILKALKKNKSFYYQPDNFSSVSGMLYRMKQNAVGLANICILSTMVLVMISTTVSLYAGITDIIDARYPQDVEILARNCDKKTMDAIDNSINETVKETGLSIKNKKTYTDLLVSLGQKGDVFKSDTSDMSLSVSIMNFYTPESFKSFSGCDVPKLKTGEIAIYTDNGEIGNEINLFGKDFVVKRLPDNLKVSPGKMAKFSTASYSVIVKDQEAFDEINALQIEAYGKNASEVTYNCYFDVVGTDDEIIKFYQSVEKKLNDYISSSTMAATDNGDGPKLSFDNKQLSKSDLAEFCGAFLFLGIYLGFLFLMDTVLIIYYKQLVEGYDDKERFKIMQKVGMSKEEVQKSIKRQILIMFFLPLVTAVIHLCFAFPMLTQLLAAFSLTNIPLFIICTAITVVLYAIVYAIVYKATAKTYYNIVSE